MKSWLRPRPADPKAKEQRYLTGYETNPWFGPNAGKAGSGHSAAIGGDDPAASLPAGKYVDLDEVKPPTPKPASAQPAPDSRFYRKINDYTEITDQDSYSTLFGERQSVEKLRVSEWRKQFEAENAHVDVPYERNTWVKRVLIPNWFVRVMIRVRDGGIPDVNIFLVGVAVLFTFGIWVTSVSEAKRGDARDLKEVR